MKSRSAVVALAWMLRATVATADPPPESPPAAPPAAPSAPAAPGAPAGGETAAAPAPAPPPPLPVAPNFALEGTSGATRQLRDYAGRAVILIYEDRASNTQNDELKRELANRARAQDLTRDVAVVPVANLAGYNFWPARGFARDAVVDIARQQALEILIDWEGSMAGAYRFRPGTSYVMVLDRAGRVRFRHAGTLSPQRRRAFFSAVSEAMENTGAPAPAVETAQR